MEKFIELGKSIILKSVNFIRVLKNRIISKNDALLKIENRYPDITLYVPVVAVLVLFMAFLFWPKGYKNDENSSNLKNVTPKALTNNSTKQNGNLTVKEDSVATNSTSKNPLPKEKSIKKKVGKSEEFLRAEDINNYIARANGANEFEKSMNGLAAFTDDFYDFYINLFESKAIYSQIYSTKEAIQNFRNFKYGCATRKIVDKFNDAADEGQPAARKRKIGEFKQALLIGFRADIPNSFIALYGFHIKHIKNGSIKIHSESDLKEIKEELVSQLKKVYEAR